MLSVGYREATVALAKMVLCRLLFPPMLTHYTQVELAGCGAVARFKYDKRAKQCLGVSNCYSPSG